VLGMMTAGTAQADTFGSGTNQFTIDFVPIGNPGNADDTTGNPNPCGKVEYDYRMGKYEISRDMITKANAGGLLEITLQNMASYGGDVGTHPATGVSWNEAARFINWLNTSKGYSPAYKFAVQPGEGGYNSNANIQLWESGDAGYNAANPFRNDLAYYFLPSEDEWYKAAYYDPDKNGGAGGYYAYPTGSDTAPTAVSGGTNAGTAVYNQSLSAGPTDIDDAGGPSPYGTVGQGGNVWEWGETEYDLVNNNSGSERVLRGGVWNNEDPNTLASSHRAVSDIVPTAEYWNRGFRVASIPEPSATLLVFLAGGALLIRRRASRFL
jgi:formylglycine-generating enzyme